MAATLMATKGPSLRLEALCTAWANSSFPVPVSPIRSTGDSVRAIRFKISLVRQIPADWPTMSSKVYFARCPL